MDDPDRVTFLQSFGEILPLAVRLPVAERGEPAIGHVALGLTVADEPDVDRGGEAGAELLGELELARRHGLAGERHRASGRRVGERHLGDRPLRGSRPCARHERRLVAVHRQLEQGPGAPLLGAQHVRGGVVT